MNNSLPTGGNAELALRLLESLHTDRRFWYENMSDEMALEFPYAKSVGMPTAVSGRDNVIAYLDSVFSMIEGLTFRDIEAYPMQDQDMVLLTYKGLSAPAGRPVYDQTYITIMRFCEGRLIYFREYWDTTTVRDALGDVIGGRG